MANNSVEAQVIDCARRIDDLTHRLEGFLERLIRLEQRGEIYTPFTHVHELFDQLRQELFEVRQSLAVHSAESESDAERLAKVLAQLQTIESRFETLAKDVQAKHEATLAALKKQQSPFALWLVRQTKGLTALQKFIAALIGLGGAVWLIIEFLFRYAGPILRAVAEVSRNATS